MNGEPATSKVQHFYGRMFSDLNKFDDIEDELLIELGRKMHAVRVEKRSQITSGYTFLGQFIDHDLSHDKRGKEFPSDKGIEPNTLINDRKPFFNLDILYGEGPENDKIGLYENGSIRLKLGNTVKLKVPKSFPNDLPRSKDSLEAATVDFRQDENMGISQMHVAFIKFHNAVIDKEFGGDDNINNFKKVEGIVIRHYQWIVLKDFLPKVIQTDVLEKVEKLIRKDPTSEERIYRPQKTGPFMPVECSVAAFRMGHSMVSQKYNWNKLFPDTTVHQLSAFTERGSMDKLPGADDSKYLTALPSRWIIDWTRFFDFLELDQFKGITESERKKYKERLNHALRIDTSILPQFLFLIPAAAYASEENNHKASLAVRNLFRGRMLGLPTGQAVAERLEVEKIPADEIAKGLDDRTKGKFSASTPLWYYILKEAEFKTGGERLGDVGSRIIAETFLGLMKMSPYSILDDPEWLPEIGPKERREKFGMIDLLMYIADQSKGGFNELNPLDFMPDPKT